MRRSFVVIICIICLFTSYLYGQEDNPSDLPAWLVLEKGKQAYNERDLGMAFRYFREALDISQPLPEAHMWMAVIYEEEGEYDLAEKHYLEALTEERELYILEDAFLIRYRLSEMYQLSREYGKYEATLKDLVASDELTIENIALRNAMVRNLRESGLDKLFELYRIEIPKYQRAYAELGIFYYKTGRYAESIHHLTLSILDAFSTCMSDVMERNPGYTFEKTHDFLHLCMNNKRITGYLVRSNFFMNLYYLGCALYAEGELNHARDIWLTVKEHAVHPEWIHRAEEQIRKPFIEPILPLITK